MNNAFKPSKHTYIYAFMIAMAFSISLFVCANVFDSVNSVVPFLLISVFDIANVLLVRKLPPRECFGPFVVSSVSFFLLYKIVSVSSVVKMYKFDGFLSDGEFSNARALDLLIVSLVISTFLFSVFLRFLLSKQKLKCVSKVSRKNFFISLTILILVGVVSLISWNIAVPYKDAYLKHVSTFSTEKWMQFKQSRINMFDDFEKKHLLTGMTVDDVEKLLGKPDNTQNSVFIYNIGDDKNGHNRLIITFHNDTVISYEIETEAYMADVVDKYQN